MPNVIAEATLPAFGTNISSPGALEAIKHNQTGIIIPKDVNTWAETLITPYKRPNSDKTCAKCDIDSGKFRYQQERSSIGKFYHRTRRLSYDDLLGYNKDRKKNYPVGLKRVSDRMMDELQNLVKTSYGQVTNARKLSTQGATVTLSQMRGCL